MERIAEVATHTITGRILINNSIYYNNDLSGIYFLDHAANNTAEVVFHSPTIIDPNNNDSSSTHLGAGFVIDRKSTSLQDNDIGNMRLINPVIVDTRAANQMSRGISAINNDAGTDPALDNLYIVDPIKISGYDAAGDAAFIAIRGAVVTDQYDQLQYSITSDINLASNILSSITNTSSSVWTVTDNISRSPVKDHAGVTIEFVNTGTGGLRFTPAATAAIYPQSGVLADSIETTDVGARMFLRYNSTLDYWFVSSLVGQWTYPGSITHASVLYDVDVDGGTEGTYNLAKLPDNAVVTRAWYDILETITATGAATIAISTSQVANEIVTATAYNNAVFGIGPPAHHDAIPDGTATNFTTKTTAARTIDLIVAGGFDLTDGQLMLFYEYFVSE
jgi:hypothetical protein